MNIFVIAFLYIAVAVVAFHLGKIRAYDEIIDLLDEKMHEIQMRIYADKTGLKITDETECERLDESN